MLTIAVAVATLSGHVLTIVVAVATFSVNNIFAEAYCTLETILQSFSFIPRTASEELVFFNIFSKIYPLCCHGNQSRISEIKIHMNRRELLKKHFCKRKSKKFR